MEAMVSEKISTQLGFICQDVATAVESARIGMAGALRMRALIRVESAASDVTVKVIEHDAPAAGNSQDLVLCLPHVVRVDGSAGIKKDELDVAPIIVAELNASAGYIMLEVQGSDLSEGFSHISVEVDGGAARLAHVAFEADTARKPADEQVL